MVYDVVIVGGGPAGLSAALALGRARKRVLLCDSGPRRNAAAVHVQNFVTRDGTPPDEFRGIARKQLARYPNVELRDAQVTAIHGAKGAFRAELAAEPLAARRVLLCTGMLDELPPIAGFRELWGKAIFQCPYCHGWEIQDRKWGFLTADLPHALPFALQARGWSRDVVVFTNGSEPGDEARAQLETAGIRLETARVSELAGSQTELSAVVLEGGTRVPCEALFAHPPQRQVALIGQLGLELDEDGYVKLDDLKRETSVPGVYAAGDLTTRRQAAVLAAASGMQAVAMLNLELTQELSLSGAL